MDIPSIIAKHPSYKLLSKQKLYQVLRLKNPKLKMKDVEAYLTGTQQEALQQTFRPLKKPDFLKISASPRSFQIDVIHLPKYKKYNSGRTTFLLLVDVMSRKAFAYPLVRGTVEYILPQYDMFLGDVDENINSVTGDNFFSAAKFVKFNEDKGIKVYTDVAKDDHISYGNKLGIIDRLTRTLKNLISKKMIADNDVRWTTWLSDIVDLYNDMPHRSLDKESPNQVWSQLAKQYKTNITNSLENEKKFKANKINAKDNVRVFKGKDGIFAKEGTNFSREIHQVEGRDGYKFVVKGLKNKYKPHQLQKIIRAVADLKVNDKVKVVEKEAKLKRKIAQEGIEPDEKEIKKKLKVRKPLYPVKRKIEKVDTHLDMFDSEDEGLVRKRRR